MQKNMKDLCNNLITDFSYHDAIITKITKNNNNITIWLTDGWNEGQIDELNFINCEIKRQDDLKDKIIYQLDDIVNLNDNKWYMSFLVWEKDGSSDKIVIKSDNIISKKYEIKSEVRKKLYEFQKITFKDKIKKIEKQIGEITLEKLKDEKSQDLFNMIFKTNEKERLLSDFSNYVLVAEEDLNKVLY